MTKSFDAFKNLIAERLMRHPVIVDNRYTAWFAKGEASPEHLRYFTIQFSVFSNQFLLAALNRVINADTLEGSRQSKEILMNELGVIYNRGAKAAHDVAGRARPLDPDREGDPELVSTEGAVEGGLFHFQAAHFEWLLRFAEPLGLSFEDMGKRRHGSPTTLFFCDELFHLYGSDDYNEALGAAFAVENWAAAGFWKELIAGLERIKREQIPALHLAFFTWHDKIEDQHKGHVWDELAECYHSPEFHEENFMKAGMRMLDGVKTFWDGLDHDRRKAEKLRAVS